MVIVSLTNAKIDNSVFISKLDYTMPYTNCQNEKFKSTLEYNYLTTEELIKSNIDKYQNIFH